jgi:Flp pilus assembly protein TadD
MKNRHLGLDVRVRRLATPRLLTRLLLVACAVSPWACASEGQTSTSLPASDGRVGAASERAPNANTLYSMSKIMVARSKDAEAETILSKLIAQHPDFMPAYADLADLYLRHDRIDSAVEVLKGAVKIAPQDAVLSNNLGMCRMLQKRYDEALDCFTAAAAGVPKDARSRANMAVALGMLGRFEESLSIYLQLVSPAEAHHNLGVLCEARKDAERAQQEFAIADALSSKKVGGTNP